MTPRELFQARARQQKIHQQLRAEIERSKNASARRPRERRTRPGAERPAVPEGWLSVREFCKERGLSETGVFRAAAQGRLETVKIGHCRYVNPQSYDRHVALGRENHRLGAIRAYQAHAKKCAERRQPKESA